MVDDLHIKMLDDLLNAERGFREMAERQVRALRGVLTELAYRLAGDRLEQIRQSDPNAPANWKPEDWRNFFLAVSLAPSSDGWGKPGGNGHAAETAALQAKIAALERELDRRKAQMPTAERKVDAENPLLPAARDGRLSGFVMPKVPKAFEHRWQVRGQMSKADAELHLKRRGMAMRCLADGLNVQVEIGRMVGDATGSRYRSGAIRRVFEALEESGLITLQTLSMEVTGNTPTLLVAARLTAEGKAFCKALSWQVAESDWERLIRLHQGEEQEAHTLAVLLFAASARLRGWQAEVLPEVQGSARPDLAISKGDERLYVEVETGTRLHDGNAKWRMNAELNGGRAVIVARNVAERRVLIADCRNIAQHGAATDIETLIAVRFDEVNENTVMWTEEW